MISTNDLKNGITIEYEGNIYVVMDTQHVKPGKGAAIVKAKLKNLRTGSIAEYTFNAGIKVEQARIEKKAMQFLYSMNDTYYFMNMSDYEQIELDKKLLGDDWDLLKENLIQTNNDKSITEIINTNQKIFLEPYPLSLNNNSLK